MDSLAHPSRVIGTPSQPGSLAASAILGSASGTLRVHLKFDSKRKISIRDAYFSFGGRTWTRTMDLVIISDAL